MSFDPYHHGDLRNALTVEGLGLAEGGGPEALTIRATARRAGVSHAAAYRHFKSRQELLASVASEAMNRLAEELEGAAGDGPPLKRFGALAKAYVTWAVSNPGVFRVAFSEGLWDKGSFPELREASDRASRPVMAAAADHLGPSAPAETSRELAVAVWAQSHGFAVLALDRQLIQGELRAEEAGQPAVLESVAVAVRVLADGWRTDA